MGLFGVPSWGLLPHPPEPSTQGRGGAKAHAAASCSTTWLPAEQSQLGSCQTPTFGGPPGGPLGVAGGVERLQFECVGQRHVTLPNMGGGLRPGVCFLSLISVRQSPAIKPASTLPSVKRGRPDRRRR